MAILGNNVKGASQAAMSTFTAVSKFTLASAATLTELHGWFGGAATTNVILVIYADTGGGNPGALVAYTSVLTTTGADVELFQTGFSVPLAAGDYWIGWDSQSGNNAYYQNAVGAFRSISHVSFNPPDNPFGTSFANTGARSYSCWAVVTTGATTPVADFTGTPLSGVAPRTVTFTDASTNTPTSWAWDFGDGATSTAQNPSHTYTNPGTYTVALTATNAAGPNTKTRTSYVTISAPLSRPGTNYIPGTGITVAAADNPTLDAVDVTIASTVTGLPTVVNGQWVKGSGGVPVWAAITEADVTNLTTDLAAKQATAQKGVANGYASLDASGLVPATQLPAMPGVELAYAQLTASKTVTATGETAADLVVAAPAITVDGTTPVIVECYSTGIQPPNVQSASITLLLYQDGASIGRLGVYYAWAAITASAGAFMARRKLTPAAGSRTWSFAAIVSGASGLVYAGTGGLGQIQPAYIRITRA